MNDIQIHQVDTPSDVPWPKLVADVAIITTGVAALGREATDRIIKTIMVFDDFYHRVDPREEHDVGSFDAEGHTIMFKIDYYDYGLDCPDAGLTDPVRVITVMLASEY
jgi:Protein of unknown function (DUF3768)